MIVIGGEECCVRIRAGPGSVGSQMTQEIAGGLVIIAPKMVWVAGPRSDFHRTLAQYTPYCKPTSSCIGSVLGLLGRRIWEKKLVWVGEDVVEYPLLDGYWRAVEAALHSANLRLDGL